MSRLIALYPPSFRDRYGPELDQLAADLPGRHAGDLLLGAARAWLQPRLGATTARLQATASVAWINTGITLLGAGAVNKALLDPLPPRLPAPVQPLVDVATTSAGLAVLLVLCGATVVAARILAPSVARRDHHVIRPLLPTLAIGALMVPLTLALANWHTIPIGLAWLCGFAALMAAGAIGPVVSLRRLAPAPAVLAGPVRAVPPAAVLAIVSAAASIAADVIAGPDRFGIPAAVIAAVAATTLAVSASRLPAH